MSIAEHLLAHTRHGDRTLLEPDRARFLWGRLRAGVEDALACVLMPDHVHVEAPPGTIGRFERVLRGFGRKFGVRWDVLPPEPGNSPAIVGRQIRYLIRNAVVDGLVGDAWEWPWSTLRDLGGVIADPWTPIERVARWCGRRPGEFLRFIGQIDGERTLAPAQHVPTDLVATMIACRQAVASTLRCSLEETVTSRRGRRLTALLANAVGSPDAEELGQHIGCTATAVRRLRSRRDPALAPALRCLADPRLRRHDV